MKPASPKPVFRASEIAVIALVGVMVFVGKSVLRLPIQVSGHGGVLWIAALVIGRGVVRRPGAATAMGAVGGLLVVFLQPGDAGVLAMARYVAAGATLDVLAALFGDRFDRPAYAVVAGAAAHAMKLPVDYVIGRLQGIPHAYLVVGLALDSVLHVGFGALGGFLASMVLRGMHRARIPQLRGVLTEQDAPARTFQTGDDETTN